MEIIAYLVLFWCLAWGAVALSAYAIGAYRAFNRVRRDRVVRGYMTKEIEAWAERMKENRISMAEMAVETATELGRDAHKRIDDNRKRVDLMEVYFDERISALEERGKNGKHTSRKA